MIDRASSHWAPVTSGVPQGSILGPNDLPDILPNEKMASLYADDTKVYNLIRSTADCEKVQQSLTDLECWSRDNNLDFNSSKCKVRTSTRKKSPLTYAYQMNSKAVLRVEKDLGVCVNSNISWNDHIFTITAKGNKMLGLLKRTCTLLTNTTVRRTLHLTLVRSQLSYATEVWSPYTAKLISKVESVQRRATAWILKSKRGEVAYKQRLTTLNLLPLCYEKEIADLVFFFKALHGNIDLGVCTFVSFLYFCEQWSDKPKSYAYSQNSILQIKYIPSFVLQPHY